MPVDYIASYCVTVDIDKEIRTRKLSLHDLRCSPGQGAQIPGARTRRATESYTVAPPFWGLQC